MLQWISPFARMTREYGNVTLAEFVRHLAQELYPEADKIRLVVDNLNIHSAASFYEVFDAERARELTRGG